MDGRGLERCEKARCWWKKSSPTGVLEATLKLPGSSAGNRSTSPELG